MMEANYFFIDGSALTAQIRQLWRARPELRRRKLCPRRFIRYQIQTLPELLGGSYKRVTFYFPKGDEAAIEEYLDVPDRKLPGEIRDMNFKFCGHKLKKSAEFDAIVEEHVPPKFRDRCTKSEKGIDIEICCDALRLASVSRIERLFLFSNDGDFIPLCRTIKEFGANISIIHLSSLVVPNLDLLHEADTYDVVRDDALEALFLPAVEAEEGETPDEGVGEVAAAEESGAEAAESDKPETEPSDLHEVEGEPPNQEQDEGAQEG